MGTKRRQNRGLSDLAQGHLTPAEALRLLDEVERDPALSDALEERIALVEMVHSEEVEGLFAGVDPARAGVVGSMWEWMAALAPWIRVPRYVLLGGVFLLCFSGWWGIAQLYGRVPEWYGVHLRVMEEDLALRLRSFSEEDLSVAADRIVAGEYREASDRIGRFLRMHPDDELVPWAEHVSEIVRIAGGGRHVWGLGILVDRGEVEAGVAQLAAVRGVIGTEVVEEEGLWYEAVGRLMLGEEERGEGLLREVIRLSGDRRGEAEGMLMELSNRRE